VIVDTIFGLMMKNTISVPILALLMLIGAARPSAASTYLFAVPETTLQTAITAAIAPVNTQLFGFYDIYIRPALATDFVGGNDLPSYTASYDLSPIPTGHDQWTAGTGIAAGDGTNMSFHFTFNPADSFIALVTANANVAGKTYESRTGEQMPGADTFKMYVTSASTLLTGTIRFYFTAVGYQFTNTSAAAIGTKGVQITGSFDAAGVPTPEPASVGAMAGGSILLAILLRRRHLAAKKQA
jgi:hypothetical protein